MMQELNRRKGKRPISYYFNLMQNQVNKNYDAFGSDDEDSDGELNVDPDLPENYMKKFSCFNDDEEISDDDTNIKVVKKTIKKSVKKSAPIKKTIKQNPVFDKKNNGFKVEF
jgi:hypothetical protein